MSVNAAELERYLTLLTSADERIDRETAAALKRAIDTLSSYAAGIAHRASGNMAEGIHALGPFAVGSGTLEGQIASGAWYTALELAKGDDHDWAARTLEDNAALLDRLEIETGRIVVTALGG